MAFSVNTKEVTIVASSGFVVSQIQNQRYHFNKIAELFAVFWQCHSHRNQPKKEEQEEEEAIAHKTRGFDSWKTPQTREIIHSLLLQSLNWPNPFAEFKISIIPGSENPFMKNPLRLARPWRFLSFSLNSTKGLLWPRQVLCFRDFRFLCHRLRFLSLSQRNRWLPKSSAIFVVASCFEFTCDYSSSSLCPSFTSFSPTLVVPSFSSCSSFFSSPSPRWFFSILLSLVSPPRFVCFLFDRPQLTRSHLLLPRRLFRMFVGRSDRSPNRRNGWCRVLGWEFTVMATFTRGNFTRGGARGVGFITTIWVEGMKAIGLMRSMMDMGLRHGRKGVGTVASTGKGWEMGLGFTDSTQGMSMQGSGLMGSAMAVEFILAKMGAAMLGSSSGVSNMDWVTTILGKFFQVLNLENHFVLCFFSWKFCV